jgi:hypothetical protein
MLSVFIAVWLTTASAAVPWATLQVEDSALREYLTQIDREWPGESHQQSITSKSLLLLADAIASVAERRHIATPTLRQELDKARALTREFDRNAPDRADQAEHLRRTLLAFSEILDRLVTAAELERTPVDPRLSAIRRAAESLDPSLRPRRQPDVLERFFRHAGDALRRVDHGA